MTKPFRFDQVQRELQRARAARRYLPWILTTALGAAAITAAATRSLASGAGMLVPGLGFGLFMVFLITPRCPSCGASLWRRGERPGSAGKPAPTEVERTRRCPACGVNFS